MEIQNFIDFLTAYRQNTSNPKNKKYSEIFIRLLNELQQRNLSDSENQRIQSELEIYQQNFDIEKEKIRVKKELKKFVKFLKSEFSLIPAGYHMQIGIFFGWAATFIFGYITLLAGLSIGGIAGYLLDDKVKKEGRQIKTDVKVWI